MRSLLVVLSMLAAGSAFAQEIGTEITPSTPNSGVNQQPQNTQSQPTEPTQGQKTGYVYKPKGAKEEPAAPTYVGNKVSASSGDLGIRAGFGASSAFSLTGTGATAIAPTVGISYFGSDSFKLLFDLGFGLLIANSFAYAINAVIGFDYLFRTPGDALRPFFHLAGLFGLAGSGSGDPGITFGAQFGFGAEYFFNPAFSVNGRLLLAVPMAIPGGNFVLGISTVTPGVGASWYF